MPSSPDDSPYLPYSSYCQDNNGNKIDQYQQALEAHYQNASVRAPSDQLIYEAISLTNLKTLTPVAWRHKRPEDHPAFLKLCTYWDVICKGSSPQTARVPYMQVFLGKKEYIPLIEHGDVLQTQFEGHELRETIQESSVIFDENFIITFLADRQYASEDKKYWLIHYTVYDKPFLMEPVIFNKFAELALDLQNNLAWQTLKGLQQFPMRFPLLWQALKKKHEVGNYEIH